MRHTRVWKGFGVGGQKRAEVLPKARRPESMSAARRWTKVKSRYVAAGLCPVCAAQAAWGHQVGWRDLEPPCLWCAPFVAVLPFECADGSGWRRLKGESGSFGDADAPGMAAARTVGHSGAVQGHVG